MYSLVLLALLTQAPEKMPDPIYKPQISDQAVMRRRNLGDEIWFCKDIFAYGDYVKYLKAGDEAGFRELKATGRATTLAEDTPVLVLKLLDNELITETFPAAEVRVLDGPHKDERGWVEAEEIRRMIDIPLKEGEVGILDGSRAGLNPVPVSSNQDAFNAYVDFSHTQNQSGIQSLLAGKRLVYLPRGTKIRVKKLHVHEELLEPLVMEVEILSGSLKRKTGWVHPAYVSKPEKAE